MARCVKPTVSVNPLRVKMSCSTVVVGVDVGGLKKGFHAVALQEAKLVDKLATCSAADVVTWCRTHQASAVAIDAPCRWSLSGRSRACERQLAGMGVSAFSTPSLAIGQIHSFYGWMLNGAELFRLHAPEYPLFSKSSLQNTNGSIADDCFTWQGFRRTL